MAKVDALSDTHQHPYVCHRCKQPLVLDPSFSTEDQLFADLIAELSLDGREDGEQGDENRQPNVLDFLARKYIGPTRLLSDSGNGFLVVGDSDSPTVSSSSCAPKSDGNAAQVRTHLFDLLSKDSDIEQPLCEECTDTLLDLLDVKLRESQEECEYYGKYLAELEAKPYEDNESSLREELATLEEDEKDLLEQLNKVKAERQNVLAELEKQKGERGRLEEEHDKYWQDCCKHKYQQMMLNDENMSVNNQLRYAENQLNRLTKENVFNNTFHIWFNGQFGTINNFRLGRLPNVPVDWSEINAAWGQTVLLLHSLAKKKNVTFTNYRLVPYGNHSYIECLSEKSKELLPLYCSGGIKYFWDTKFDMAMGAFLECVQEFAVAARFALPYKISLDKWKLEDKGNSAYCIKMQFNPEEAWTKALKFMLTNLKWGIAHVFGDEAAAKKASA